MNIKFLFLRNFELGGGDRKVIVRIICKEFWVGSKEKVLWEYKGKNV